MGEDPLIAAVRSKDAKAVAALLAAGADPDTVDEQGTPALCLAVDAFDLPVIEELMLSTPPVRLNCTAPDGRTPLLRAVDGGDPVIASVLVSGGADPELTDAQGRNALELARHWHLTGTEAELRRRSGASSSEPVVRRAALDGWGSVCRELSLGGLTVRNGHTAILTELEPRYGIAPAFAELMGRALAEPDVGQPVWTATTLTLQGRRAPAVLAEATALRDRPNPLERYCGAEVIRLLNLFDESDDDPYDAPLVDLFLPWAAREEDPRVMRALAAGLAEAMDRRAEQLMPALTRHPDREVRRWALSGLHRLVAQGDPEALAAVMACARDTDAQVRESACRALGRAATDSPAPWDALAARLHDEAEAVRVTAAIELFVHDDPRGDEVLRALGPVDEDSPYHTAFYAVRYHHRPLHPTSP
ncbi:HEAT repeat domain-containing protein [Streptosporangium nondiastaticum]|uniref:HEAT repeat domain-containing protein n=1 Tax=Streptosporangium nondiastaticum TaxID=35764 RepID=UPI00167B96AF|nr:HEAT repeat domain-containing protein [Streptosporangium nondiastaticum]